MNIFSLITVTLLLNLSIFAANEISPEQRWQAFARKLLNQNNGPEATLNEKKANKIFLADYMVYMNKLEEIKQSKEKILRDMNNFGMLSHEKDVLYRTLNQSWTAIANYKKQERISHGLYQKWRF